MLCVASVVELSIRKFSKEWQPAYGIGLSKFLESGIVVLRHVVA